MILSMTGFGRVEGAVDGLNVQVEVRTLNGKQHDVMLKAPSILRPLEPRLRQMSVEELVRGRVEMTVFVEKSEKTTRYDKEMIKAYYAELNSVVNEVAPDHKHDILGTVLRMPDVMAVDQTTMDEKSHEAIISMVGEALGQCVEFRRTEGSELQKDMAGRVSAIRALLQEVEGKDDARNDRIRERLNKAFDAAVVKSDPNRFEQELVYYLEKLDINEEKVRLAGHCDLFMDTMNETPGQGRKLNFITQEMGREINTMGSKANDLAIQHIVVQMKDELDKIKEQTLNVL